MKPQKRFTISLNLIMLVIVLVITLFVVTNLDHFWVSQNSAQPQEVREALLDACIQCYALEGSYPPSLDYLNQHYGAILDKEKYFFYYEVFASNVLPTVEVYEK